PVRSLPNRRTSQDSCSPWSQIAHCCDIAGQFGGNCLVLNLPTFVTLRGSRCNGATPCVAGVLTCATSGVCVWPLGPLGRKSWSHERKDERKARPPFVSNPRITKEQIIWVSEP